MEERTEGREKERKDQKGEKKKDRRIKRRSGKKRDDLRGQRQKAVKEFYSGEVYGAHLVFFLSLFHFVSYYIILFIIMLCDDKE